MIAASSVLSGTVYGLALNDRAQVEHLGGALTAAPYKAPPRAPVLYIKPRNCFSYAGAPIILPSECDDLQVAATIGLLFARDLSKARPDDVRAAIGAACLALDVSEPSDSFYRPAIREQCRDGFLPLGRFARLPASFGEIVTAINGETVHRWSLDRLVRSIEEAAAQVSSFMTLAAGDLLLVGLPGDAPRARAGQSIVVASHGLPPLTTTIAPEAR